MLSDRSVLLQEFDSIYMQTAEIKTCPTLELGSMLCILYLACTELEIPILEKDILQSAKDNSIGYFTHYRGFMKSLPNNYLQLKPVSVP